MKEKFLQFVAGVLERDVSELSMEMSRKNGDWSSLMHIRLVAEICDEYDVDIPIDEIAEINTLEDFYRYIAK